MSCQANELVNAPFRAVYITHDDVHYFYVTRQAGHRCLNTFLYCRGVLSGKFDLTGYFEQHG